MDEMIHGFLFLPYAPCPMPSARLQAGDSLSEEEKRIERSREDI
jgi:hypothetical protein